jgi:3-hydroxyisobutyrate dehydrogenase
MTSTRGSPAAGRPRVAVLGTGIMGAGIARNLLRAGLQVDVWNRTPAPATILGGMGAVVHRDPADAAASADVVVTMLADAAGVRAVALEQGMLAAMRPGAAWAQMGTIGVAATSELAGVVAAQRPDVDFVDAPVSGSRMPAEAGELVIFASGPDRAKTALGPVFGAIGQSARWLGEAGAGTRFKLVTNTWLAFLVEGVAEVLALAGSLGVDRAAVLELLGTGPMSSPVAAANARKMDAGDDSPVFSLQWAVKDAGLALEAAPGRALSVLAAIRNRWQRLAEQDMGGLDISAARHGFGPIAATDQ